MALGGMILQEALRQNIHQEHQRRGANDTLDHDIGEFSLYQTGEIIELVSALARQVRFCYERSLDAQAATHDVRVKLMNPIKGAWDCSRTLNVKLLPCIPTLRSLQRL